MSRQIPSRSWGIEKILASTSGRTIFRPATSQVVQGVFTQYIAAPNRVLELGSGIGELGSLLDLPPGVQFVQSELEPNLASHNAAKNPQAQILVADACRLPFTDSCFDAVVALTIFDILSNQIAAMQEVARVLKPGGRFLHFHDLGVMALAMILRQPASSKIFPLLEGGRLVGMQIVPSGSWAILEPRMTPTQRKLVEKLRPVLRGAYLGLPMEDLRRLSSMASDIPPNVEVSRVRYGIQFSRDVRSSMAAAGLEIEEIGLMAATVEVPYAPPHGQTARWINRFGSISEEGVSNGATTTVVSKPHVIIARKSMRQQPSNQS